MCYLSRTPEQFENFKKNEDIFKAKNSGQIKNAFIQFKLDKLLNYVRF